MRIGIFGGSFDPIHLGHLLLAQQCVESAQLEKLFFVPAAIPPHKLEHSLASNEHRLAMIKLAIGGNDTFCVDTCELDREGVSFTVDTLRSFTSRFPADEIFLLMGADSLYEFHTWKDPHEICELAIPLVGERPGSDPVDFALLSEFTSAERLEQIRRFAFTSKQVEISSSQIQRDLRQGKTIRYQTPKAVEQFILEKKLYIASHADPEH